MTPLVQTLHLLAVGGYPDAMLAKCPETILYHLAHDKSPEWIAKELYGVPLQPETRKES